MNSGSLSCLVFPPPPSPPPTPAPPEASLSTQERLRLAKRRRAAQLKRWAQREREKNHPDVVRPAGTGDHVVLGGGSSPQTPLGARRGGGVKGSRRGTGDRIQFVSNVMLLEAAARNDVEEVRRLLELGVSPDSTNEDGLTALHQCCIDDSAEMMRILVEHGGNPNATDTEKWTPLHAAATCGHLHLVKFLIDHGADLLAVNADGNMPYDLCEDDTTLSYIENEMAKRGVTQELIDDTRSSTERRMLRDLQSAPSDLLEWRDRQGATPLHIAAANGYLSVVEFLLDNHVTTDSVDNDLWQPIHAAACWGHLEVVELLAQNGANISAKTKNGETPFDICEDPEIKERLIQLKEQRVRLDQPKVRRSRSSSTRTQSIRRTSLREKMNVTKKDVQDEKLFYIHTFDAMPGQDAGGNMSDSYGGPAVDGTDFSGSQNSKPVVDINDVQLEVLPESRQPQLPPRRPPRTGGSVSPVRSPSISDKINIHVSVTINNAPSASSSQASPMVGYTASSLSSAAAAAAAAAASSSPGGTTLADLKKARSQSRTVIPVAAAAAAVTAAPPMTLHQPQQELMYQPSQQQHQQLSSSHMNVPARQIPVEEHSPGPSSSRQRAKSRKEESNNGFQKYTSVEEVVGPPVKKTGCCVVM